MSPTGSSSFARRPWCCWTMSFFFLRWFLVVCPSSSFVFPISQSKATAAVLPRSFSKTTMGAPIATPSSSSSSLQLGTWGRDADFVEMMVGGERYEMVPLPDSMVDTTIFVGNLNEFVKDDDLSELFQSVSTLQTVPACVARRPNFDSLEYGFVSFPTVEEKEAAILRFHGREWRGRAIKVEPIVDHPRGGRVRVPEKIVSYVSGAAKKTRNGQVNTLRRISQQETQYQQRQNYQRQLQQEKKKKRQQHKQQHQTPRMTSTAKMVSKLSVSCQEEFLRASRKGFVSLPGTGYRRGRKSSSLACAHRQWCDDREVPQIILCKASGGRPLDNVIIDLSPLRILKASSTTRNAVDDKDEEDFLLKWKLQIVMAANNADMVLRTDYKQDNCEVLSAYDGDSEDQQEQQDYRVTSSSSSGYVITLTEESHSVSSVRTLISKLPVLSMGVFEGERSKAKAMAQELALLWDIPQEPTTELQEVMNQLISSSPSNYPNSSSKSNSGGTHHPNMSGGTKRNKRESNPYRNGGRKHRSKQRRSNNHQRDLEQFFK